MIRLRTRADRLVGAWVATGFGVLAVRVVAGEIRPADLSCAADRLVDGLRDADDTGYVDPGYPMDSGWRGALPPETGFFHVDDVPVRVLADLARRGADLAREHGSAHGPPASLLDQEVLRVGSDLAGIGIPMRCVLALAAMRFLPQIDDPQIDDSVGLISAGLISVGLILRTSSSPLPVPPFGDSPATRGDVRRPGLPSRLRRSRCAYSATRHRAR